MSVVFDQLRVSDDGKSLYIDAHVNKASYFANAYISKITVCTEDQIHEPQPWEYFDEYIYQQEFDVQDQLKEIHLVIGPNQLDAQSSLHDFSHNMFFVYVEIPDDTVFPYDTPCGLDSPITLGVTFDYGIIYNQAMGYTRELADSCDVSSGFIDFILNHEALKISLETEHYIPALTHWKWLMNKSSNGRIPGHTAKPCGCHG